MVTTVAAIPMNRSRTMSGEDADVEDNNNSSQHERGVRKAPPATLSGISSRRSTPLSNLMMMADDDEEDDENDSSNNNAAAGDDDCNTRNSSTTNSTNTLKSSTTPTSAAVLSATTSMRPPPWEEHSRRSSSSSSRKKGVASPRKSSYTSPYAFTGMMPEEEDDESSTCGSDLIVASQNDTNPETNSLMTSESEETASARSHRSSTRHVRILEAGGTGGGTSSSVNNDDSAASLTAASSTQIPTTSSQLLQSAADNDQPLIDPSAALNFAMEHRIFLKAALGLLTERDRHAPELGMMDPIVLKAGALKKASHLMNGVWKVKYVEIRRGMFSYYENASSNITGRGSGGGGGGGNNNNNGGNAAGDGELLLRKNIPLEAAACTCRAVKLHQKALNFSPGGAIFELAAIGANGKTTSTRLWMATSREERQAWIHAINNAMVGGSVTRGDSVVDHRGIVRTVSGRSPFKNDLRKYLKIQSSLRSAKSNLDYLSSLRELLNQQLEIPVKWIAKQAQQGSTEKGGPSGEGGSSETGAWQEETVARSVDQLWRDLQRDSVQIDGAVFRGDSPHGPERILGALTRCLLQSGNKNSNSNNARSRRSDLRESKALVYARDILLAGNRTRSGGDSYYCVSSMCQNADLVVVVPSAAEVQPVAIDVSEDDSDESFHTRFNDKSGWIKTRNKLQRTWRKQFFVLSEGTLSFYEGAIPRPHGLRGQRVLTDVIISVAKKKANEHGNPSNCDQFILTIALKDSATKDRLLLFENEDRLLDWVYALECVTRAMASSDMSARKTNRRRSASSGGEQQVVASSMGDILNDAQQSTMEHALKVGLDCDDVANRLANYSQRATSAIRVSVTASTEYNVCTTDPQGDESQDKWAIIQAQFLQTFKITGGPNGRIRRGEEVVRLSVVDCIGGSDAANTAGAASSAASVEGAMISPSSRRTRLNRRIFRGDDGETAPPPSDS